MDVILVPWPTDRSRREELRQARRPRLLLVEEGEPPPEMTDLFEDWVRLPADEADVRVRVQGIRTRVEALGPTVPTLDEHGVLRFGSGWASIPPVEARITRALLDRYGLVVGRDLLSRAGWPGREPGRNALDVHVLRLRRRIEPLGLQVRTVRSRGYLLEAADERAGWRQMGAQNA